MKKVFLFAVLALGVSCQERVYKPEVSTTEDQDKGALGVGIFTKPKEMDREKLEVTTFVVDHCTYIAVQSVRNSSGLQVVHSESCSNHIYTSNGGYRPIRD